MNGMNMARTTLGAVTGLVSLLLSLPIVLAAVPFWIVRWSTRGAARLIEREYLSWQDIIHFDPHVGWKTRPNLRTGHFSDDIFRTTTDADGWRGKAGVSESKIILFGDSFAWGYGIDDEDFFASLDRELKVKAIGTIGYNLVQEYLWMERLAPRLRGKLVVWTIYLGNDLADNLATDMYGYRTPFVREVRNTGEWEIVTRHLAPQRWPLTSHSRLDGHEYLEKLAELCGPSFLSTRAYAACEFLIRQARNLCADAGAELVVVTIPERSQLTTEGCAHLRALRSHRTDPLSFDPDYPDREIGRICSELGIPFFPAKGHLDHRCYKTTDCHWNRRGHQHFAELLKRIHGTVPISQPAAMDLSPSV